MMTFATIAIVLLVVAAVASLLFWRHRPRQIKSDRFQTKWLELQKMCSDKQKWPEVLVNADKLLDDALKKKHISGKNMGERLVKAQRSLTDNDGVWFGHKLRGQLEADPQKKLKESDIKDALIGIRQALKDLGALPESKAKTAMPTIESVEKPTKPVPPAKAAKPKRPVRLKK
jgi:hypothetical protein